MSSPKLYGSRFCRQCGKLFTATAPDGRLCAACGQRPEPEAPATSPAPAAVNLTAKPQHAVRHEQPAVARNSGPATGQRTLPMLRALAGAPRGLTTPQLAKLASSASSWLNALGTTRQLMLKQERLGRVEQAGIAAGNRTRGSALWRITSKGEQYVRDAEGSGSDPGHAPGAADREPATGEAAPLPAEWAELTRRAVQEAVAAERTRVATLMLERITDMALNEGEDGWFVWSRLMEAVLYYARGKLAAGEPLTPFEQETIEEDTAEQEGRLFYRMTPDGRVEQLITPCEAS